MIDLHPGRGTGLAVRADPVKHIEIIRRHGIPSSIQRGRKCPHAVASNCKTCGGRERIYEFQRRLLEVDESSVIEPDGIIRPFRVPVLEPVLVENVASDIFGGVHRYEILGFGAYGIKVAGDPEPWMKVRSTYWFDRFETVTGDAVQCDQNTRTVRTRRTEFDDGVNASNHADVHGDLIEVSSVRHEDGYEYTVSSFRVNEISLEADGPPLETGKVFADYVYAPVAPVLPQNLDERMQKEKWGDMLSASSIQAVIEPWFELTNGDVIVFRQTLRTAERVINPSYSGIDDLNEFEVGDLSDGIIDAEGKTYELGTDYVLHDFSKVRWIGRRPSRQYNVRFRFRPAYVVFDRESALNDMERRRFPQTVPMNRYSRLGGYDALAGGRT